MLNLGKIFKQKLEQQEFDATNKYWMELEKRLDNAMPVKKNNRKILWFLFPIIGAFGIYFYAKPNAKSVLAAKNKIITQNETHANISNPKNNINAVKYDVVNTSKFASLVSKNNTTSENTNENITEINVTQFAQKKQKESNQLAEASIIKYRPSNSPLSNSNPTINKKETNKIATEMPKSNTEEKQNFTKHVELADSNEENMLAVTSVSNNEDKNSSTLISLTIPQIKLFSALEKPLTVPSNTNASQSINSTGDKSKSTNHKTAFSVSVYGGAMYVDKKILSANNAHSDYVNRRILEEKNTTTSTVGADVNYNYNHLILTTGINYHTQSEIRNYSNKFYRELNTEDPYWEKVTSNYWKENNRTFTTTQVNTQVVNSTDTISYFDAATGNYTSSNVSTQTIISTGTQTITHTAIDSILVYKEDSIQKTRTTKKIAYIIDENQNNLKGKNTISYIEIPILIGYQMRYGKIGVALKTGIGFGVLSKQTMYYLSNDVSSINEIKIENCNKLVYNYILRLSFNYYLSQNWAIVFDPNFRTNLNSVTKTNADFQQKYWNIGGNIGLNYTF